jgi:hypothetical protein
MWPETIRPELPRSHATCEAGAVLFVRSSTRTIPNHVLRRLWVSTIASGAIPCGAPYVPGLEYFSPQLLTVVLSPSLFTAGTSDYEATQEILQSLIACLERFATTQMPKGCSLRLQMFFMPEYSVVQF